MSFGYFFEDKHLYSLFENPLPPRLMAEVITRNSSLLAARSNFFIIHFFPNQIVQRSFYLKFLLNTKQTILTKKNCLQQTGCDEKALIKNYSFLRVNEIVDHITNQGAASLMMKVK